MRTHPLSVGQLFVGVLIAATLATAPTAQAEETAGHGGRGYSNPCTPIQGSTDLVGDAFNVGLNCGKESSDGQGDVANQVATPSGRENPNLRHSTVSACVPHQLSNPDYGSCPNQDESFCPDGEWVQARTVDITRPDADPLYGRPTCTSDVAAGADGARSFTLKEIRTLLLLDPTIESDNAGRGVRNAETNFYTDAGVETLSTTINGVPVELRATPVSFHWNYGDGTAPRVTHVGGHAQAEFNTPTPTSHVYEETGEYTVTLATVYIGEYREADGDWVLIPGTITLDAAPVTADIWRTVTRNVAEDCAADPSAWGCTGPIEAPDAP